MVTLAMRPAFTSSRNWEYSIGAWVCWRVLNWLNTVIRTSPMTSQITRFLKRLFNLLPFLPPTRFDHSKPKQVQEPVRGFSPLPNRYISLEPPREAPGFREETSMKALRIAARNSG